MSEIISGIECIGVLAPFFAQVDAADSFAPVVSFGRADDVLEAQITSTGNAPVTSVSDPKWFLAHKVSSGPNLQDTNQEVWIRIIEAGEEPPFSAVFGFASNLGAKSIGIQGWRYCDIDNLIAAVAGSTLGELIFVAGFGYSYSELVPELLRGESAFGYSYVELLDRLAEDKGGFGYAYVDWLLPLEARGASIGLDEQVYSGEISISLDELVGTGEIGIALDEQVYSGETSISADENVT